MKVKEEQQIGLGRSDDVNHASMSGGITCVSGSDILGCVKLVSGPRENLPCGLANLPSNPASGLLIMTEEDAERADMNFRNSSSC